MGSIDGVSLRKMLLVVDSEDDTLVGTSEFRELGGALGCGLGTFSSPGVGRKVLGVVGWDDIMCTIVGSGVATDKGSCETKMLGCSVENGMGVEDIE